MEVHEFTSDRSIIVHFIESQAGSLAKALLEYVQNSADANASKITIDLDEKGFRVVDDGEGMPTRELILEVFKTFGFDHTSHKRQWGRFGLGRAQAWNFASTKWYTHNFMLDVDVRERGLEWHLHTEQPHQPGLVIEGTLYEKMSAIEQADAVRELSRLCKYLDMTVIINGEQVNRPPAAQKWTEETDTYYLKVSDSNYLHVYNMGVHVCDIFAGTAGAGGTVVTKPDHPLALNVARNDIMRNKCTVWPTISERLRALARERADKPLPGRRITDADRDYMAQRTADPEDPTAFDGAMFTLSIGRHITLARINQLCGAGAVLTKAERGDPIAERLYREKRVVPLVEQTLDRFGVSDVYGLQAEVTRRIDNRTKLTHPKFPGYRPYRSFCDATPYNSIEECPGFSMLQSSVIPHAELSKKQKDALRAIKTMSWGIADAVAGEVGKRVAPREIVVGLSNHAEAYTDGSTYIAVVNTFLDKCLRGGLAGFHLIANVLVHEYLHNTEDTGSHTHDPEFMEAFHEVMVRRGVRVAEAAANAYETWARNEKRLARKRAQELDVVTGMG